jgi:hypothetical protein
MRPRVLAAGCCWLAMSTLSTPAAPCGAFMARASRTVPSLSVEQTLIVFDPEQELEHFVRQIAIREPSPGFGVVVPVPEQPSVAKVDASPFAKLARAFPVAAPTKSSGRLAASAFGGTADPKPAAVEVISRQAVGSFTAFVLAASDSRALQKWLTDNQLVVPPQAADWFAHYVKLDFYFVALRYETQATDAGRRATRAETIRITFKSALPFYPYREPALEPGPSSARELAVWLVSTRAYTPVSLYVPLNLHSPMYPLEWRRPLVENGSRELVHGELDGVLSDELMQLLPGRADGAPRSLTVQVFEDQKRGRRGYGDIVMVPKEPLHAQRSISKRSRKLMASLDPGVQL